MLHTVYKWTSTLLGIGVLALLTPLAAQDANHDPLRIVPHRQVALVIGNRAYQVGPLRNPIHDATDIAARLEELGYQVTLKTDAGRRAMDEAVDEFVKKLGAGDVALFYYSGHGAQVDGENYLLPVDFDGHDETSIRYYSTSAGNIQRRMEKSGTQLNILILDACRDNPFYSGIRSKSGGLAKMEAPRGTLVAFATAPGRTARDNPGQRNGLFTKYLLEALRIQNLDLDDVFNRVRTAVYEESGGAQLPWTLNSVVGSYSFAHENGATVASRSEHGLEANEDDDQARKVRVNTRDGLTYVWIPPGRFRMGCSPEDRECEADEKPAHQVTISRGFWLGQTQVTQAAYQRVEGRNPSYFKGDRRPVDTVSWDDAAAYCIAAGMRLPTEAEWEYAARSGNPAARYGDIDAIAWYGDNSGRSRMDSRGLWNTVKQDRYQFSQKLAANENATHDVAQKQCNAWKLCDMLGNVWEWTADWYGAKYYEKSPETDPHGPSSGRRRVLRGGSCYNSAAHVRVSYRSNDGHDYRSYSSGFRCAGETVP